MTMTKREKILIIIVLIMAVLCVYYIYFFQPNIKELEDLAAERTNKEMSLATNEQMKSSLDLIIMNIADSESQILELGNNISSGFDQPAVLVYLHETIGKRAQKGTFEFEAPTDVGQLKVTRVRATMKCTYEILKSILKSLSEGEYFVKVVELDVSLAIAVEPDVTSDEVEEQSESEVNEDAAAQEGMLNINLIMEFYNIGSDVPAGRAYPFSNGYTYGGNIFF